MLRPVKRQTLTAHVYDELLAAITSGKLPPGHKLVIDAVARELNVSITPVREAIARLLREGLLSEVPFAGVYVSSPSEDELRELFAIRGVLEGYAVRLAVDRLGEDDLAKVARELAVLEELVARGDVAAFRERNTRFHGLILARADGRALPELLAQLGRNTNRYMADALGLDQAYLAASQAEHRRLFQLLKERRGEEAEMLARHHAITFVDHLARVWRTAPGSRGAEAQYHNETSPP